MSDKNTYNVVEIFESINGEGKKAGELAAFVRMKGCNLSCEYCDTKWANEKDAFFTEMTQDEIIEKVNSFHVKNVTITGGEPLFRSGMRELIEGFSQEKYNVEIETNGSVSLKDYLDISKNVSFTMDYKLPESGMERFMNLDNFSLLGKNDTVKFVASSRDDLEKAYMVSEKYLKDSECQIFLSPVFGKIELREIVEFMIEKKWNRARMQIQMHKVIWDPDARGV